MNKDRRAELASIVQEIQGLAGQIEDLKARVEEVRDEEQEYYDNMPESFQQADRGYAAEAAVSELESAISMFDDFDIDSLVSSLETAAE